MINRSNLSLLFCFFYHFKQKPWAALGAAATIRDLVPLLDYIRTYFGIHNQHSTKELKFNPVSDSSGDIAAAGRQPAAVFPSTTTNADQPEQETKKTNLTSNSGIIFQARQEIGKVGLTPPRRR